MKTTAQPFMTKFLNNLGWIVVILLLVVGCNGQQHRSDVPSIEVDCAIRRYAFEFALEQLPWSSASDQQSISDALRLDECPPNTTPTSKETQRRKQRTLRKNNHGTFKFHHKNNGHGANVITDSDVSLFVDPDRGNDEESGDIFHPLRTIEAALGIARSQDGSATVFLRGGRYHLEDTLVLDSRDNNLAILAFPGEQPILSGGDPLSLVMKPTRENPRVYSSKLPPGTEFNFTTLFLVSNKDDDDDGDGDDLRLVWAREPNGHPERDLQPDGYARANGTTARTWPDTQGAMHVSLAQTRNSTVYPYFGQDLDPRGGGNWLHFGGTGNRFVDKKGFWNGTVPMGLSFVDLNTTGWTPEGYAPAIAHVFHNGFWGNWQFVIDNVQTNKLVFSHGGWQEGRGGGIGNQPFYVEGVKEALDVPGEWWLDVANQELFYYPFGNETKSNEWMALNFVAPRLQRILSIVGDDSNHRTANGITIRGITFAHSATTFMEPYEVPSPGDWSIHRGAAVVLENVHDTTIQQCRFLRTGGNAILVSGHAKRCQIQENEFAWVGDSAIVTLGKLALADGFTADTFPEDSLVESNHFHEIGIHGKQTSALFSALSCRTSFVSNVAYNGPRAGININDQFCHGHRIRKNLLFNWVRETQDHGPINTWDRALYFQAQPNTTPSTPTTIPEWTHIDQNFIFNGPSGNRDLGNLFPTIDNDDGSSYYSITRNLLVYGGAKNYLGHDKRWISNLLVFPGRWSHDPCAQIWGGKHHYFENNTCWIAPGDPPIGLDGSMKGFERVINWTDPQNNLDYVGKTGKNQYFMDPNYEWGFRCGNGTSKNHFFGMDEFQEHGWEIGSEVRDGNTVTSNAIMDMAKTLLETQ